MVARCFAPHEGLRPDGPVDGMLIEVFSSDPSISSFQVHQRFYGEEDAELQTHGGGLHTRQQCCGQTKLKMLMRCTGIQGKSLVHGREAA